MIDFRIVLHVDESLHDEIILDSFVLMMPLAFFKSSSAAALRLEETFCLMDSIFFCSSLTCNWLFVLTLACEEYQENKAYCQTYGDELTSLLLIGKPYLNKLSASLFTRLPDPLANSLALATEEVTTSFAKLGKCVFSPARVAGAVHRAVASTAPDKAVLTVVSKSFGLAFSLDEA